MRSFLDEETRASYLQAGTQHGGFNQIRTVLDEETRASYLRAERSTYDREAAEASCVDGRVQSHPHKEKHQHIQRPEQRADEDGSQRRR